MTDGMSSGTGPADRRRCDWSTSAPEYLDYHDQEWGVPVHGDNALFERLSLEGCQAGLSWLMILRKRENYRRAFADFDIKAVAEFDDSDRDRLLADAGIVRNRAKIDAIINNARIVAEDLADGGLSELLWSYAPDPGRHRPPATLADVASTSPESVAMSKHLKKRGLKFVGPTTMYALMQAVGMVDDHVVYCWRAGGQFREAEFADG